MRVLLIIMCVVLSGLAGCAEPQHVSLSNKKICGRMENFWEHLSVPQGKVAFFGENNNKPIKEIQFKDLKFSIDSAVGCAESGYFSLSNEAVCERLKKFWATFSDSEIKKVVFYSQEGNEPFYKPAVEEIRFENLKAAIFYEAGCCYFWSHPLAKEWMEYTFLDCIWESLQREKVLKIAFCEVVTPDPDKQPPEVWWCNEVVEPEKIKEIMKLLGKALEKSSDRFANEDNIKSIGATEWMQIVTDKHKFIAPAGCYGRSDAIRGVGWTSYELMEELKQWFPQSKESNQPK